MMQSQKPIKLLKPIEDQSARVQSTPIIFDLSKPVEGKELPEICIKLRSQSLKVQLVNLQLLKIEAPKEHLSKMQSVNTPVRITPDSK